MPIAIILIPVLTDLGPKSLQGQGLQETPLRSGVASSCNIASLSGNPLCCAAFDRGSGGSPGAGFFFPPVAGITLVRPLSRPTTSALTGGILRGEPLTAGA
jgi:hypothetical protein